eukprot:GHUV01026869.1.p1 GENE.GHUV01026869.1~~GHUV01026869.1.p1  ORF type:complete len:169 (+),score=53.81 GHUV01026869.1:593-1099(+)
MESTNMLENAKATMEAAREKGVLICHVPITFSNDYRELAKEPYGILGNVKASGSFKRDGWGGAICEAMTPEAGDVIIQGKSGLCGFASTNLNFVLAHNHIENVVLAGFLTNCCVDSSMRTAYELGYRVYTLSDCCAATSQEEHDASVKYTFPMFSKPMPHQEFLQQLQ